MRKRLSQLAVLSFLITGCAGTGPSLDEITKAAGSLGGGALAGGSLSTADITQGLKAALSQSSNLVVDQLGASNGFSADPAIRIPLPATLVKARNFAEQFGLAQSFDDLELRLNQAAEQATPKARQLFLGAITDMSVQDANGILQGPDDAATSYFQDKTGASLKTEMRPLVDQALANVGAVSTFNTLLTRYNAIPLAPKVDADLSGHVVDRGTKGIFYYIAQEEKAIRTNPLKRTTELLQRVFGAQ